MNHDTYTAAMRASLAECVAALQRMDGRLLKLTASPKDCEPGEITRARKLLDTDPAQLAPAHEIRTAAAVGAAAQQIHDAADKLHALLGTACAVHGRILLESLAYVRRGADDLQQFAADLAEDQRDAVATEDAESMAEEAADKAARRATASGAAEALPHHFATVAGSL